jgi:hemerythrin superfamily protein
MDALVLLTGDHHRVRGLFARFKKAKDSENTDEMAAVARKIFEELDVHTTIEEEIFYPAVKDLSEETAEVVAEGYQEHHVVKLLMEEIGGLRAGDEDWTAKMAVLIENVEHHAEEEETQMFREVRSATDDDTRRALAERLEERKAEMGAPTMADKAELTMSSINDLARRQQIPGRSSMSKEELTAAVDPRPGG